jgi:hypothetical protein
MMKVTQWQDIRAKKFSPEQLKKIDEAIQTRLREIERRIAPPKEG